MIHNVGGESFGQYDMNAKEEPNLSTRKHYDMLDSANKELWPRCDEFSKLSTIAESLSVKFDYHLAEACFDRFFHFSKKALPRENVLPDSFYRTKKLIHGLGLPIKKINCCR